MARFNISGVELAEAVKISQSQMSKISRGLRHIDLDLLERICWAVALDVADVLREAELQVSSTGYVPPVLEVFVEENFRVTPRRRRTADDVVRGVREYDGIDELTLAADTADQAPDEDLRTP